jgi:hypothetical protein
MAVVLALALGQLLGKQEVLAVAAEPTLLEVQETHRLPLQVKATTGVRVVALMAAVVVEQQKLAMLRAMDMVETERLQLCLALPLHTAVGVVVRLTLMLE